MNRLIHIIIAVCILVSQSAWAFYDIELDAQPEQVQSQNIDQYNQADEACDHFCHANAHMVGLFYDTNIAQCMALTTKIDMVKELTSSISYQPPTPPPNS